MTPNSSEHLTFSDNDLPFRLINYFYFIENREKVRKLYFPSTNSTDLCQYQVVNHLCSVPTSCNDRPNFLMCFIGMIKFLLQEFIMKMKHIIAYKALGTGHDTFQVLKKFSSIIILSLPVTSTQKSTWLYIICFPSFSFLPVLPRLLLL